MTGNTKKNLKKRNKIIDAALSTFLENGYGSTTIDKIVKKAGGSKATVYNHFKDKADLFSTVIDKLVKNEQFDGILDLSGKPDKVLYDFAVDRLKVVFNKKHSLLISILIGENSRFPKIAKMYYMHGPEKSRKQLVTYFVEQEKRGQLKIDDPELAADIFQGMLMHAYYLKTLYSMPLKLKEESMKKRAKAIVEKFIKIYKR